MIRSISMIETRFESLDEAIIRASCGEVVVCTVRSKAYEVDELLDPRLDGVHVCVWPTGEIDRIGEA